MRREDLADLTLFQAVAEERSFTRAAARLGTSQSGLSQTIRRLEERLGLRLLSRTTRSVAPTEAGQKLLDTLRASLDEIATCLSDAQSAQGHPGGSLRLTVNRHALDTLVWPVIDQVTRSHPAINIEISIDPGFSDIVAEGFDAGVRLGEHIEKDMVALRIGPPLQIAVVGSPAYFADHPLPRTPRDLTSHACINMRIPSSGGLYVWEFEQDGKTVNVRVEGQLVLNDMATAIKAALGGHGLLCTTLDQVQADIDAGRLLRVLADWTPPFDGHYIYYPHRRQVSPALAVVIEALRNQLRLQREQTAPQ